MALIFLVAAPLLSQTSSFTSIPAISFDNSGPVIRANAESEKPFTVAGERGVLVGQQDGTFEAWLLPVKLLSHLTIEAEIQGYTVPIEVNRQAATVEVRPDRTVITYSHIGFTVRQIMFSPNGVLTERSSPVGNGGTSSGIGPVVLFEFDCVHPTDFTLRFTPELRWMWPARNAGVPGVEWVAQTAKEPGPSSSVSGITSGGHGYYVLHSDYPDLAGAVTIPGAQPGILAPYQERPQVHPVELKLHIDNRDHGRLFPLLMAVGMKKADATNAALGAGLEKLNTNVAALYKSHDESYKKLLANSISIETPDKALNEAFQWAVVSIEQLKTKVPKGPDLSVKDSGSSPYNNGDQTNGASAPEETALVAGYYASGDSARPGFGWFFGRDALYTLYAVNGYGDFALSRSELEFLIRRQRADGKIMHEYSQTAPFIDWLAFPYMYAAADSTPLFLLAVADYVRASGDTAFLTAHRDAIEKAWAFETDPSHDTDHDGIYDNSQGTGWVESWPGGMPHQEIYLALLDQQASSAMAEIEKLLSDSAKSAAAKQRSETIAKTIEAEYYDPQKGCYAFSRNADGSDDHTRTVYPALAWWDPADGKPTLAHPDECLRQLVGASLNTDWGLRDVGNDEKIYDGMSYHQGSVWPLFTGWAALAEYRGGQPIAGYQLLMENANLTLAQDLGAVTELLSGDFFVPFGRSTSHQLWSSAMVITPILRGLFGMSIDAQSKTIRVNPHLPANWDHATVRHVPVGENTVDLFFTGASVQIKGENTGHVKLATFAPGGQNGDDRINFSLPAVAIVPAQSAPLPGARTASVRVLSQTLTDNRLTIVLEGPAEGEFRIPLFLYWHLQKLDVSGAELQSPSESEKSNPPVPQKVLMGHFPPGTGWKTITVTLTW
jgi:glycogen debranching enzyme